MRVSIPTKETRGITPIREMKATTQTSRYLLGIKLVYPSSWYFEYKYNRLSTSKSSTRCHRTEYTEAKSDEYSSLKLNPSLSAWDLVVSKDFWYLIATFPLFLTWSKPRDIIAWTFPEVLQHGHSWEKCYTEDVEIMGSRPNLPKYKCDRTMYSTLCVFPECALRRCHAACLICIVLDIDLLVRNLPVTEYRKLRRWTIQCTSTWTVQPSSRLVPIDSSPYYSFRATNSSTRRLPRHNIGETVYTTCQADFGLI